LGRSPNAPDSPKFLTLSKIQNPKSKIQNHRWGILLIILLATVLRLWDLPHLPLGLHYDEAANTILIRQIVSGGYRPIFIHAYTGKEVLFFYVAAFWVWITGQAVWGMRLASALLGVLTVAATYPATRALLGPGRRARQIALLAAGGVAVAFPHLLLSRYGFRAISQPLLQALTVAALWFGLRTGKTRWFAAGGLCLGLTGYTYLAARLFPIPLGLALAATLLGVSPEERRKRFWRLLLALAVALVVFAPLGWHFLRHPEAFSTRITQVAAASWQDAARGFWQCARALVWPGAGDAYVRFNIPGRPLWDPLSALLAIIGLGAWLFSTDLTDFNGFPFRSPPFHPLRHSSRHFLLGALLVMLLPSALATGEITPSNLRLVGLWPFLAILPAWGLVVLWETLRLRPAARVGCALLLLGGGGLWAGQSYRTWAASPALFATTDGDMTLTAQVLDATDLRDTTVYIASQHYRHPTVAALARQYSAAKWLTGGASLVLPPQGDALYLIPRSLPAPAAWPDAVARAWTRRDYPGPDGTPALTAYRLDAAAIAALRPAADGAAADFAHVVLLHDARPAAECRVAEPCPVLLTWEACAPYPALEPVVRLTHPQTGEWARTMAFHYPPEQWTPGDVVLDQLTLTPPVGTPPGDGYQLSVGFYNPDAGTALPRLKDERFAGLEALLPATGLAVAPATRVPTPEEAAAACPDIPRRDPVTQGDVRLLGWTPPVETALPGARLLVKACWQAADVPSATSLSLTLTGPETHTLYSGPPSPDFPLAAWRVGEVVEGRYLLRLPKTLAPGAYTAALALDAAPPVALGVVEVQALARNFALPAVQHPFQAEFVEAEGGGHLRLLGYDAAAPQAGQAFGVTLYWQTQAEVRADYVVFIHLLTETGETLIAQVDEAPRRATYPTSLWLAGEIVADDHTLTLPDALPAGPYILRVGWYRQETGEILSANGAPALELSVP